MKYTDINNIGMEEVLLSFQNNKEYSCVLPFLNRDSEIFLSRILKTILEDVNQGTLFSHLEYALNELSMNASKANSKRLYFKTKNLDIHNPVDYKKGISTFKEDVFDDFSKLEQSHIENEFYVKINLAVNENFLNINVLNGSPLLKQEQTRITERLRTAHKFENLTDVLTHGFDTEEGGGFGLIVVVLMLRKISLDEKSLKFASSDNQSISNIKIPLNLLTKDQSTVIAAEIVKEIDQMPQFPESIVALQNELRDPNCCFETISDTINSDITLAAEILRIANSPVYMIKNKISDIAGAVRLIGMLGVKSVLYNYGVNKVLKRKYNKDVLKEINTHSFHVALIGSYLARFNKFDRYAEDIYVAALLHDVGKIIVTFLQKDLEKKLESFCRDKHIPVSILDDLTEGYNHALIGSEIVKKWDFPDKYINVIAYHHLPLEVKDEYKVLTYAVYLSNEIYHYIRGERDYNDINVLILSFFKLEKERDFLIFIDALSTEGIGV